MLSDQDEQQWKQQLVARCATLGVSQYALFDTVFPGGDIKADADVPAEKQTAKQQLRLAAFIAMFARDPGDLTSFQFDTIPCELDDTYGIVCAADVDVAEAVWGTALKGMVQ